MRLRTKIIAGLTAVLAGAGLFAVSPLASAEDSGVRCTGSRVIRCITTGIYNGSGTGYDSGWASASVLDADGGPNLDVKVTHVAIQRYYSGSWHTLKRSYDFDGWFIHREEADTAHAGCNSRPHRTKVLVSWRYHGSSTVHRDWLYGPSLHC